MGAFPSGRGLVVHDRQGHHASSLLSNSIGKFVETTMRFEAGNNAFECFNPTWLEPLQAVEQSNNDGMVESPPRRISGLVR
jgi:hypothetical protein